MNRLRPWLAAPALLALAVGLLAITAPVDARYNAWSPYDELLFVRQAMSLARGEWLGAYDQLTLAKGPGFALWLVLVHFSGVPVLLAAAATHAAAAALAVVALKPLLPSVPARLGLFAALLFVPTALGEWNLMRELVYPAATLALVAASIGWMLRFGARLEWLWAGATGAALAAVLLLREDAVWFAPLALPFALRLLGALRAGWRAAARDRSLRMPALAALVAAAPMLAVLALNLRHYGVATWVELNSRPFTAAYGALMRIGHAPAPPQVPVPRESWQKVATWVPLFRETERHLSGDIGNAALGPGIGAVGPLIAQNDSVRLWLSQQIGFDIPAASGTEWLRTAWRDDVRFRERFARWLGSPPIAEAFLSGAMDNEIAAWRFVWFFRDSVAAAGHHASAGKARLFYRSLAEQIDSHCRDNPALGCGPPRRGLMPPLADEHLRWWPWAFGIAVQALVSLEAHTTAVRLGYLGKPEDRAAAAAFLHQRMAPAETTLPPVQPLESLIVAWRALLPALAAGALMVWLAAVPWRWRSASRELRWAWGLAGLCLALVAARLALLALVHVSSWPAATLVRYLAPAHPVLVLFIGLALTAGVLAWRRWRGTRR